MAISIDKALGIHPQALQVRSRRTELLATNIAHADTPNYKAIDIDFKAVLNNTHRKQMAINTTDHKHIALNEGQLVGQTLYRVPNQPSLDGNTVDTQIEKAEFTRNAVRYQATLRFLSGRVQGLMTAIRGE